MSDKTFQISWQFLAVLAVAGLGSGMCPGGGAVTGCHR